MFKILLVVSFFLLPQVPSKIENTCFFYRDVTKVSQTKISQDSAIVSISDFGTLWVNKDRTRPILFVFGGISVGGRSSGEYMWDYVNSLKDRYHIFVSKSHKVVGDVCYQSVLKEMNLFGISSNLKILYLFSGGWSPGKSVLEKFSNDFQKVLLVDIWMGNFTSSNFYVIYTSKNSQKVEYYYTSWGSQNSSARDEIIKSVRKSKISTGNNSHMFCNVLACESLLLKDF